MNTDNSHIDNLIARYLAGDISPEERFELESWMESSPENKKYFGDVRYIYFNSQASCKYTKVDTLKAWDNLQEKMYKRQTTAYLPQSKNFPKSWLSIAASLALLLSIAAYIFTSHSIGSKKQIIAFTSANSTIVKALPGNTFITLNKNSKVEFKLNKRKKQKEITLSGEAFIEVKHCPDTPLVVIAGQTYIRDIGTSFNVKAYDQNDNIEVYVKTGEVEFYTDNDKGIILKKGEQGIYYKTTKCFRKKITLESNITAYKTKNFVFNNTRLSEVVDLLNNVYQTDIRLENPSLANCPITVSFNNESIETILEIISETLELKYKKTGNGYLILGNHCQTH